MGPGAQYAGPHGSLQRLRPAVSRPHRPLSAPHRPLSAGARRALRPVVGTRAPLPRPFRRNRSALRAQGVALDGDDGVPAVVVGNVGDEDLGAVEALRERSLRVRRHRPAEGSDAPLQRLAGGAHQRRPPPPSEQRAHEGARPTGAGGRARVPLNGTGSRSALRVRVPSLRALRGPRVVRCCGQLCRRTGRAAPSRRDEATGRGNCCGAVPLLLRPRGLRSRGRPVGRPRCRGGPTGRDTESST